MADVELTTCPMEELDQIKEIMNRLGFGILLVGTKYFFHVISRAREHRPNPLAETAEFYHKDEKTIDDTIFHALTEAWKTKKYWPILFQQDDLLTQPSSGKLITMIFQWMEHNEVVYLRCEDRPLQSHTELRTKTGDFIAK